MPILPKLISDFNIPLVFQLDWSSRKTDSKIRSWNLWISNNSKNKGERHQISHTCKP